jgi:RNA polymerase sigma-70 factor (sigma-E family)
MDEGGEADAVEFCRALRPRLVGSLALHCGDLAVAEELAQDAFVRLVERWPEVSGKASPEAWTFRVAFNLCASRFRRRAAEHRAYRRLGMPPTVTADDDTDEVLAMRAALAVIPPRQRAAVVLRHLGGLTVPETAEALGCPEGTVKSLTARGLAALRALLGDGIDEEDVHA